MAETQVGMDEGAAEQNAVPSRPEPQIGVLRDLGPEPKLTAKG